MVACTIFLSLNANLQAEAMKMGALITSLDVEEAKLIKAREIHGQRAPGKAKVKVMPKP